MTMACIFGNIEPENRQLFKGSCSNIKVNDEIAWTLNRFKNNIFVNQGNDNQLPRKTTSKKTYQDRIVYWPTKIHKSNRAWIPSTKKVN